MILHNNSFQAFHKFYTPAWPSIGLQWGWKRPSTTVIGSPKSYNWRVRWRVEDSNKESNHTLWTLTKGLLEGLRWRKGPFGKCLWPWALDWDRHMGPSPGKVFQACPAGRIPWEDPGYAEDLAWLQNALVSSRMNCINPDKCMYNQHTFISTIHIQFNFQCKLPFKKAETSGRLRL